MIEHEQIAHERRIFEIVADLDLLYAKERVLIAERNQEMYRLRKYENVTRSRIADMTGLSFGRVSAILAEQSKITDSLAEQLRELGPRMPASEPEPFVVTEPSPEFVTLTTDYRKQLEDEAKTPGTLANMLEKLKEQESES